MEVSRPAAPEEELNPFGPAEMARTLAWFFMAGGLLGGASLLVNHSPDANVAVLATNTSSAFITGVVLLRIGGRLPTWAITAFLAVGILAITNAAYFDGRSSSVYTVLYLWVGVEAFYFLPRRMACVLVAQMGLACAWVLYATHSDGFPEQRWILTIGTSLGAGLLVAHMRKRIERLLDRLSDAASTDALTGLMNRRAFEESFGTEIERSRRDERPLSILVGDLDGFKLVNDRCGHQVGDQALRRLAAELERWKRRGDVASRVGGEEFALLLPDTGQDGALSVADRIRVAVGEEFADDAVPLTISFGIATFPDHAADETSFSRVADQALYAAKEMGRDRCVVYSSELSESLSGDGARVADSTEMQLATVVGLAEALDIRDTGTARHSQTVGEYAAMMARAMGLARPRVERIRLAGLLHDVGKIGISDRVLTKPGPLDDEEWMQMRTHPQIGAKLLNRPELADLRTWILAHHERPDGKGYPFSLAGDAIPLEARILAVADAYEAMTADRVYRRALGHQSARVELIAGSGTQFDGEVVDAFLEALEGAEAALVSSDA